MSAKERPHPRPTRRASETADKAVTLRRAWVGPRMAAQGGQRGNLRGEMEEVPGSRLSLLPAAETASQRGETPAGVSRPDTPSPAAVLPVGVPRVEEAAEAGPTRPRKGDCLIAQRKIFGTK